MVAGRKAKRLRVRSELADASEILPVDDRRYPPDASPNAPTCGFVLEPRFGYYYVGVPIILGSGGVEKIIELELTEQEQKDFTKSVNAVKELVGVMNGLMANA